jgi:glycosyltransferase involved in cell wall biosynthesis
MKILHISFSDSKGGASIAGFNIFKAQKLNGMNVEFLCFEKIHNKNKIIYFKKSFLKTKVHQYKQGIDRRIIKFFINDRLNSYSTGLLNSNFLKFINDSDHDIVNLHWVNNSMLSISDIGRINKKIVWTLHDMWPFCGSEHFTDKKNYQNGYKNIKFFNLNKFIWKNKKKSFGENINFVSPSNWMYKCAKSSELFKNSKGVKIPYTIDFEDWKNLDKSKSRGRLNLNIKNNEKIIIFGSERGSQIERKNFSFLMEVISKLILKIKIRLIIFGGNNKDYQEQKNLKINYLKHISDKKFLNTVYSAGDLLAMPSKIETFGLVALESLLSGTPCVSFKNTGAEEVIDHKVNGYLANYLDKDDYEKGILWILDQSKNFEIYKNTHHLPKKKFGNKLISDEYKKLYKEVLTT